MTCERGEQLIAQALDGALTARERNALDAHLLACPACRAARTEYAMLAQAADAWARGTQSDTSGDEFADRVWGQIAMRPGARAPRFRVGWAIGAGLVACACVALGALLPPLPVAPLDAHQALRLALMPPFGTSVPAWSGNAVSDFSAWLDATARMSARGYALPGWVPSVLAATLLLNLLLFARARRQAAS